MANKLYNESSIQAIANAIRSKNGTQNTYTVSQMGQAILNIPSGGASIPANTKLAYNSPDVLRDMIPQINDISSQYTDMRNMFANSRITSTQASLINFDTSNVTTMRGMFFGCESLSGSDGNMHNWDISKVTTMESMFQYCSTLRSLALGNWHNTNSVYVSNMFYSCNLLQHLWMQNFDFTLTTGSGSMFGQTSNTRIPATCWIYVKDQTQKDWFTANYPWLTNVYIY